MNEPASFVTILLTIQAATILCFLLYFRSASTCQNDLKEKVAAQDVELIRLRSKITKLKLKLGSGRTKTAALRNLQQLRRTKLLELGVAHDVDDNDNNHNNETNPASDVSFLSTTGGESFSAVSPISTVGDDDDVTHDDDDVLGVSLAAATHVQGRGATPPLTPNSSSNNNNSNNNNDFFEFPISPSSVPRSSSTSSHFRARRSASRRSGESRDDDEVSPRRSSQRLSTPRRLYHQKRSRRLSLSDDDGQGMEDEEEREKRGDSEEEESREKEEKEKEKSQSLGVQLPHASPPASSGRRRLTTQPLTLGEPRRAERSKGKERRSDITKEEANR